jgi:hypothetical protein
MIKSVAVAFPFKNNAAVSEGKKSELNTKILPCMRGFSYQAIE